MGLPALQIIPGAAKGKTTQPFLRVIDGGRTDPLPRNRVKGKNRSDPIFIRVVSDLSAEPHWGKRRCLVEESKGVTRCANKTTPKASDIGSAPKVAQGGNQAGGSQQEVQQAGIGVAIPLREIATALAAGLAANIASRSLDSPDSFKKEAAVGIGTIVFPWLMNEVAQQEAERADAKPKAIPKIRTASRTKEKDDRVVNLFHGTDIATAMAIESRGISRAAASEYGGGDIFWLTENIATARVFAEVNPAGGIPSVVGTSLPERVLDSMNQRGAIEWGGGIVKVHDWEAFNAVSEFYRIREK